MTPTPKPTCLRGHSDVLRATRPNGRRGNCIACAMLARTFPCLAVPADASDWPELLRPGNEELLLRWQSLPRHDWWRLGGVSRVTALTAEVAVVARGR